MNRKQWTGGLAVGLLITGLVACSSDSPVAPSDTSVGGTSTIPGPSSPRVADSNGPSTTVGALSRRGTSCRKDHALAPKRGWMTVDQPDGPARRGQRRRELARPPQGRRRVTARERIDQRLQGIPESACHRRFGRPAPGRRMRPTGGPPRANSRRPLRTVTRANPVAADTMASPPYPMANDSAAAHTRRLRSSNTGATAAYFSSFRSRCTRTSRSDTEQRWNLYFGQCPKGGKGPRPRPQTWVDGELFDGVVTPATFDPASTPFDELYAGGNGFKKNGLGERVPLISESKPGDQDYNGGRWHMNVLRGDVDPDKYEDATSVEDLDLADFDSMDRYFECPLLPRRGRPFAA